MDLNLKFPFFYDILIIIFKMKEEGPFFSFIIVCLRFYFLLAKLPARTGFAKEPATSGFRPHPVIHTYTSDVDVTHMDTAGSDVGHAQHRAGFKTRSLWNERKQKEEINDRNSKSQ